MNVPEDREYTQSHEWVRVDGESAVVGITTNHPATDADSSLIKLPKVGDAVKAGDIITTIISSGANRIVRAPLSGSVVEVNRTLESHPELIRQDPYGAGWLLRLEIEAGEEFEHLLDSDVYCEQIRAAQALDIEVP
jgi:glycine cleavage system H protein